MNKTEILKAISSMMELIDEYADAQYMAGLLQDKPYNSYISEMQAGDKYRNIIRFELYETIKKLVNEEMREKGED